MPKKLDEMSNHRWVAMFMTACLPVEKFLMGGHPLTTIEANSIARTIEGLQTALDVWARKNRRPIKPFLEAFAADRQRVSTREGQRPKRTRS